MITTGFLNMLDSDEKRMGIDTSQGRKIIYFKDFDKEMVRRFWGKKVEVKYDIEPNPMLWGIKFMESIREVK